MALAAGDIAFVSYNSDTNKIFAFVTLVDIPAGEVIKFTDNGWTSAGAFRANEGIITWTAPVGGVSKGQVITINTTSAPPTATLGTVSESGDVNFSTGGDQVLAYQGPEATPTFVAALNNEGAGVFQADATSSNTSALPTGLTLGTNAVALTETDNAKYNGILTGTKEELLAAINNNANWTLDDATNQTFTGSFTITSTGGTPTVTIAATDASAAEAGNDPGTFRISRTGDTAADLTVSYIISGVATNSADYTPNLTGTATITAGQSFVDITITPVDDLLVEGSETVILTLSDTANYDLGATTIATVAIADNDDSDNYIIGGFSFDAQNIVTTVTTDEATEALFLSDKNIFNSLLLETSGTPLASQTVGALFNPNKPNHYLVLGEEPLVGGVADTRLKIELTWGGSRLVNDSGDDFVVYENGSGDAPEAYAVAVRRTSTGQFTDFLYQFYDTFDDPAVNGPADNQGVLSTAFDLSDFGLESGESIDAIHIINLISTDTVSRSTGDGFVNLPNIEVLLQKQHSMVIHLLKADLTPILPW